MDRRFSNATSSLASAALKLCTELANYWRIVLSDQGYRPELHYMRGPGPKWREAHARPCDTRKWREPCQDSAAIHFSKREFSAHYPADPRRHPLTDDVSASTRPMRP
jgi:hypothetical protein